VGIPVRSSWPGAAHPPPGAGWPSARRGADRTGGGTVN